MEEVKTKDGISKTLNEIIKNKRCRDWWPQEKVHGYWHNERFFQINWGIQLEKQWCFKFHNKKNAPDLIARGKENAKCYT